MQPHETQPRLVSGLRRLKISDDRTKVHPPVEQRHVQRRLPGKLMVTASQAALALAEFPLVRRLLARDKKRDGY